ncbi:MAG: sugar nucleotide-binding protein [Legionellaceae bacterium]|nr:sugar nucleotide-binding protein [Legionellaceae bacterium]
MKKALIIGIDSSIGSFLHEELRSSGLDVFGTSRKKESINQKIFYLDLLNIDSFSFEIDVDVVFLCASLTTLSVCGQHPELCHKLNVDAQLTLSRLFLDKGVHVVFLSTSAVFNGKKPSYKISDTTSPITVYGESKAIAEKLLLNLSKNVSIVRLTKVLTPSYPLICDWIEDLKIGKCIAPFHDLQVCPISVRVVTSCLKRVAENKVTGIIHLSGALDVSYLVVAEYLARHFTSDSSLVNPKSAIQLGISETDLPMYTSLDMNESKLLFSIPDITLPSTLHDLYLT